MEKKNLNNLLWKEAKKKILGGNSLFSKRPENFVPNFWPAYYHKAKGCYVWDLNKKKYIDMSLMGVGTNILGYAKKEIDNAVIKNLKKSNMSTLNCPEEVYLAQKLLQLHKWAGKVKFARTGGEANAIAIRIARAYTNSSRVAVCGYHGWHDWYLSANLKNNNQLNSFLLKGLNNKGVPRELSNITYTFKYNEINKLESLLRHQKIKIIKMEVIRNIMPSNNFLINVKKLANKYNAVLIFDECTSGFRETFGGIHSKFKITPDLVIYGKALGNGYPITCVLGKNRIMKSAGDSFISSTFWSDRSGPTAALATMKIMKKIKSWKIVDRQGKKIKKIWLDASKKYNLSIIISGLNSIPSFSFNHKEERFYKTFFSYYMLKLGFLANTTVIVSTEHNDKILLKYKNALEKTFKYISLNKIEDMKKKNKFKKAFQGFYRLN